ncbi:MAG: altronate hydrolase [Candidatus Abyssobacteria bacterium SURF_17]|uniref:Altronate hydrolase n=1 Tax=Candidatus Abyssobacteria bacterium SURF_17 TaxID=2093361 RepID=A0A419F296_9BACT|nr:MAG: altronate hydrolase [Candidatus Abyssubacteria bacterium SURF_17]
MGNNAFKINARDNIVVATQPIKKGEAVVVDGEPLIDAVEDIAAGYKVAIVEVAEGKKVYCYGEPIVEATRTIRPGEWTHVHNTRPIPGA